MPHFASFLKFLIEVKKHDFIFSCCQGEGTNFAQPTFCFERNGCFGLEGLGRKACSARLINSIGVTLESTRDQIRRKAPNQDGGFIRIHNTRPKK